VDEQTCSCGAVINLGCRRKDQNSNCNLIVFATVRTGAEAAFGAPTIRIRNIVPKHSDADKWKTEHGDSCARSADNAGIVRYGTAGVATVSWLGSLVPRSSVKLEGLLICPSCSMSTEFHIDADTRCDSFGEQVICSGCGSSFHLATWAKGDSSHPVIYLVATTFSRPQSGQSGPPQVEIKAVT
jgi:hypothetical protein